LVIDPFAGAGSTGVAAVKNHRDFMGNDVCVEAVNIARARLAQEGSVAWTDAMKVAASHQVDMAL
jgi:DNA modification methylase